jgi:hypothetical protein
MDNSSSVATNDKVSARREPPAKLAHTIPGAAWASGSSRSALYNAIAQGKLRAKKFGRRTLILDADLRRFLRGLRDLKTNVTAGPDRRAALREATRRHSSPSTR